MALVKPETFDGKDVAVIFIVGRLSEGKRVEQVLSDHAIDFAVDVESFQTRLLGILPVQYEGIGVLRPLCSSRFLPWDSE
jgi:hypothetical protein